MLAIRRADERGRTHLGWLDSRHTFSFGDYHDPRAMGFSVLRVINDDRVRPGAGFPRHPHRDMEIVSYVLDGAIEHQDSLGTGSVIKPGEVQRMTAGTGVLHSEYNPSKQDPLHFLQIWILPERGGLPPSYEQKSFSEEALKDQLHLVASRDGRDGSITIHQDVRLFAGRLGAGAITRTELDPQRTGWLQVARGAVTANGQRLGEGDGAAIEGESALELRAEGNAEVLLFDLPRAA
ncbi:MAG TPA: pirin family protein [Myxococcaceae bacterium]|nr:pirin family protein [Myxococcaceae bacterium]